MGLTYVEMSVSNVKYPEKEVKEKFFVDSGAIYSVVPSNLLKSLGITLHDKSAFILANGEKIERDIGYALFKFNSKVAPSTIIFGEPGDSSILGITTLEMLGFVFDPLRRELKPLPMLLALGRD